jgi:hypothetical protein
MVMVLIFTNILGFYISKLTTLGDEKPVLHLEDVSIDGSINFIEPRKSCRILSEDEEPCVPHQSDKLCVPHQNEEPCVCHENEEPCINWGRLSPPNKVNVNVNNVQSPSNIKLSGFGEVSFPDIKRVGIVNIPGGITSKYDVSNQLKLKCFSSAVSFSYISIQSHKGIYILNDIESIWGDVIHGISMVQIGTSQKVVSFSSQFNLKEKTMTFYIEDVSGKVMDLPAISRIHITIIINDCIDDPIPISSKSLQFSSSSIGVISR